MPLAMHEPTRVFALRHGHTAWNALQRVQGQLDVPLDDTGRWQAERLALALAAEPLAAIYSSDLQRALATAQALARRSGAPLVIDTRLRERALGSFEGCTHAEIERRWPEVAMRWRRREADFDVGGGETLRAFNKRALTAVLALAALHPGQAIAIVSHGGVLDCLYRAAVGAALDAPRSWSVANATINRLLCHGEGLSLLAWDDHAHLQDAGAATEAVTADI
jgi:probable phosphoglycerate mutase